MMENTNHFFGITFSENFHFNSEQQFHLAQLLFANPNTYPAEAKKIMDNISLWPSEQYLLDSLEKQILVVVEKIEFNQDKIIAAFCMKLVFWGNLFTFPTQKELLGSLRILGLPQKLFLKTLFEILITDTIAIEKIFDFMLKYNSILSEQEKDMLLDFYNQRIITNASLCGPGKMKQAKLF